MTPTARRILWIVLAAALLTGVAWMIGPTPRVVATGRTVRGPLRVTIDEDGETRVHPRYVVAAPVAGRLAALTLDEGDSVRRGETVARLAPQPLDPRGREQAEANLRGALSSLAEAEALLARARSAHELARRALARSESLAAAGQLSAEALDRARTDERTARQSAEAAAFHVEATRCAAEVARAALLESGTGATIELCAPADGRVLRLFEDSERVVPAGAPILELGDPSRIEVVVDVLSTDAVGIPRGAPMRLHAGSGRVLEGRVRAVEPVALTKVSPLGVEEQRVEVIGDVDGAIPELGDRYRLEVSIVIWESADALKAPAGAVFRKDGGWAVFVAENGRARERSVAVGRRNPEEVEILSGLAAGETVIVHPGDLVKDGTRVTSAPAAR